MQGPTVGNLKNTYTIALCAIPLSPKIVPNVTIYDQNVLKTVNLIEFSFNLVDLSGNDNA